MLDKLSPEALAGGPLARVRSGDVIRLDAVAGRLDALVEESVWAARECAELSDAQREINGHGLGRELFAGLRRYFRFEERAGIASLWQAFGPHLGAITHTVPGAAFGLCLAAADPGDESGFDYAPAVEVSTLSDLPEGLSGIRIAPREWAVFRHPGHVSTLGATCAAAGEWLARSGRQPMDCAMQMIERYGPEFDAHTGNGGCEVWLPVAVALTPGP